jgi:hypothetical protein
MAAILGSRIAQVKQISHASLFGLGRAGVLMGGSGSRRITGTGYGM